MQVSQQFIATLWRQPKTAVNKLAAEIILMMMTTTITTMVMMMMMMILTLTFNNLPTVLRTVSKTYAQEARATDTTALALVLQSLPERSRVVRKSRATHWALITHTGEETGGTGRHPSSVKWHILKPENASPNKTRTRARALMAGACKESRRAPRSLHAS